MCLMWMRQSWQSCACQAFAVKEMINVLTGRLAKACRHKQLRCSAKACIHRVLKAADSQASDAQHIDDADLTDCVPLAAGRQ